MSCIYFITIKIFSRQRNKIKRNFIKKNKPLKFSEFEKTNTFLANICCIVCICYIIYRIHYNTFSTLKLHLIYIIII